MIIKGKSRNNAGQAGSYLSKLGKNERVELIETRGTLAADVKGACAEMEALAAGTNCDKFLYHASINPAKGEHLTPEQWALAVEKLENKLGLEGHQRVIVEHEKEGRAHRHILWNRIDPENLKAVRMSWNYVQHEQTAREIENEFKLEKVQGVHVLENGELRAKDDDRATYAPNRKEVENAKKSGVNLYKWRQDIRAITADKEGATGAELIAALEKHGHIVAQGRKVDFLVLDPSGKPHRMAQSLGLSVDDLKEWLSDVERGSLPKEQEAQERQKVRLAEIEKDKAVRIGAGMYDRGDMASQQRDAVQHAADRTAAKRKAATVQRFNEAGKEAGNRKEKESGKGQTLQQGGGDTPKRGGYSQRESLLRDIAPEAAKRATTEQTDRKQRLKAARKEVFEKDFSKSRTNTGQERDGWERERERER